MINVSERAATELRRVIDEQGHPELAIRVFVQGACGCGKANYGMGLENQIADDEQVFEAAGVKLVVDSDSATYLEGAEIDYQDSLMGRGFMIRNSNQTSGGCGCGR